MSMEVSFTVFTVQDRRPSNELDIPNTRVISSKLKTIEWDILVGVCEEYGSVLYCVYCVRVCEEYGTVLYCVYCVRVCEEYGTVLYCVYYQEYVKSMELYCTVFTIRNMRRVWNFWPLTTGLRNVSQQSSFL